MYDLFLQQQYRDIPGMIRTSCISALKICVKGRRRTIDHKSINDLINCLTQIKLFVVLFSFNKNFLLTKLF